MISQRELKGGEQIYADFVPEELRRDLRVGRERRTLEKYFSEGIEFQNTQHLAQVNGNQAIYIGNHQSHMDYILAGILFLDNLPDEGFPHIIAGSSLNVPYLPKLIGFDYTNAGVCWIDRKRAKKMDREYLRQWGSQVEEKLKEGKSFMIYPEGTRVLNGEKKLDEGFRGGFFKRLLTQQNNPFIVPLTVAYDKPIEEPISKIISWARKDKPHFPSLFSSLIYYGADALAFSTRPFRRNSGRAFLRVGKPKRLNELVNGSNTINEKRNTIRDYVCSTISKDYSEMTEKN